MKDREASPREWMQKERSESNEEEDGSELLSGSSLHRDDASAAELQTCQHVVTETREDADRAPPALQPNENLIMETSSIITGQNNSKGSDVCVEKQHSPVDRDDDRTDVHDATTHFSSSRETAQVNECKETHSPEAADSVRLEDCSEVRRTPHSENFIVTDSTSTARPIHAVQESTQAVCGYNTVNCSNGTEAEKDRKQYRPASDESVNPNLVSKVIQDWVGWQAVDDAETSCKGAAPQVEHTQEVPFCSEGEGRHQLRKEDYLPRLNASEEVGSRSSHNVCGYVGSDAKNGFDARDLSPLTEKPWHVQQSNANCGRTRLIRSIRNSFTDASEWPRFARLLHFSQVELESAGVDVLEATAHRKDFPRFAETLFVGAGRNATQLFPLALFVEAARLQKTETINGTVYSYSEKLLEFRDAMLCLYLQVQRTYHHRLCEKLPIKNGSLPPLQDRLPQVVRTTLHEYQQGVELIVASRACAVTLPTCLHLSVFVCTTNHRLQHVAFVRRWFAFEVRYLYEAEKAALQALKPLTDCILILEALMISEKREALLAPPQQENQQKCTIKYLQAFCTAISHLVKIVLPRHQAEAYHQPALFVVASAIRWKDKTESETKQKSYATTDKKKSTKGRFFGIDYHMHLPFINVSKEEITFHALNEQAVTASHSIIYRFKELRDFLWARRKCLDHLDPHLNKDVDTIQVLKQFEAACRLFRRRILRPGSLV